jgi:hypothetical protein
MYFPNFEKLHRVVTIFTKFVEFIEFWPPYLIVTYIKFINSVLDLTFHKFYLGS